ncbi:MAG: MATE family efflux transporter [Candidatus Erginobacter occultus]|nr:MATE family efflux transporter [Candidatus Erginobacter occultus]
MPKLLENSVRRALFQMAFPMLAGTIAMNSYNLADTWFVSRLGTIPLAAMGYVFPVAMLLRFLAGGLGTGVTTLTSHALGRTDRADASRVVTHGVILIVIFSVGMALAGFFTVTPLFKILGADDLVLPLVRSYMWTWYAGAVFMALPMMGGGILISLGESKSASTMMVTGSLANCLLDPILIFGWLGFPALGIWGAALATVIAQAGVTAWLIYLLTVRHRLLRLNRPELSLFPRSCRQILGFAIPGAVSMMLMPFSAAVMVFLASSYGNRAVAAVGAAIRVENFAFVIPMALGISLIPFVSQNFGGRRLDRIRQAKNYSALFAFVYGLFVALVFFLAAPFLASVFTREPGVAAVFVLYVRIVSFGYGMMEIHRYCGFILTGLHRPLLATVLNLIRVGALLIPLCALGSRFFGLGGIFTGRLLTDLAAGALGLLWVTRLLRRHRDGSAHSSDAGEPDAATDRRAGLADG